MSVMTIDLPEEAEAHLAAEAKRRSMTIDQLIIEFAKSLEVKQSSGLPAFVGAGASEEGTSHQIDDLLADGFGRN